MRAINVFLAILVSFVLGVLVLEGGLRLFPVFRPAKTINHFDAKLGWSKEPGATAGRKTGEFDIEFVINDKGLRDDAVSHEKPQNTFRVLCLGDSFTLGYTVDREHLFVDHLERFWKTQERRVDVVNAGTEGYSTDQEVAWFLEEGKRFQPDLVLLFPYENDIYWNGQTEYTRYPKPRFTEQGAIEARGLVDPGPQPALLKFAIGNFAAKVLVPLIAKPDPSRTSFQPAGSQTWVPKEFAPLFLQEPDFLADCKARTKGSLIALRSACAEIGAKLVVAPIPSESAIDPDEKARFSQLVLAGIGDDKWSPDKPVDYFRDLAEGMGVKVVDARPELRAAQAEGKQLYFHDEWHFTPAGNEVFARALVAQLDGLNVFPEAHRALGTGSFKVAKAPAGFPTWLKLFGALWVFLGASYILTYPAENKPLSFLKVGGMLTLVFCIFMGVGKLLEIAGPNAPWILLAFAGIILGFVVYKLGRRVGTIAELLRAFTLRGHWYLMPLVVVLLSIGSLLVVAASSPLIAPFIYTLF